jgi:outer membrane biosynthesis protein TonB
MKRAWTISAIAHAVALGWGLVAFSARPLNVAPAESLPVDIVSLKDFTQMTAGTKTAPKAATPKPLVEKVAETKSTEDPARKVKDKPEITTASAEPPPLPEKPPEPKPEKAAKKKPDPIADVLKKEKQAQTKPTPPPKTPLPPRRPVVRKQQPKFDPDRVAALLDKRDPQRRVATGERLNPEPTLGTLHGRAATLSQSEIDALRAQIQQCWNPPVGVLEAQELIVKVQLDLNQDGSLVAEPKLVNNGSNPLFRVAAESALRAIKRCAPYHLPIAKYDVWRSVEVTFDPRDMFRG